MAAPQRGRSASSDGSAQRDEKERQGEGRGRRPPGGLQSRYSVYGG